MGAERVAIVGSREGANLDRVVEFVRALWAKFPDTILVSGGARGVDQMAEQTWLNLGGAVESFRPIKTGESWGIEKWELGGEQPRVFRLVNEPTWADFKSAAIYRDILIAERADRLVSFQAEGGSRGADFTAWMAQETYDIPTYRYYAAREAA